MRRAVEFQEVEKVEPEVQSYDQVMVQLAGVEELEEAGFEILGS